MRAVVFHGVGDVRVTDVPDPSIEEPDDAIVRPVAATTCDFDQMIFRGETPFEPPLALGHECVAEVVEVGEAVTAAKVGQVVVVPWHVSCWECDRCRRGVPASCRVTPNAMYGLPVAGDWGSMFSDLLRVPHADGALVPLPPGIDPAAAASAGDNLPAAYEATAPYLRANGGGELLILGGCGSIALYAISFALAAGASRVDYVDDDPARLGLAERLGATCIEGPPPRRMDDQYAVTVDASNHDPAALACALRSVIPEGSCTTVGIYFRDVEIPMFELYVRGVLFHAGKSNARPTVPAVLELLTAGEVDPSPVTTEIVDWEDMPRALADPSMKPVFVRDQL